MAGFVSCQLEIPESADGHSHQPADDTVSTKVSLVVVDMNEALEQLLNLCLHSGNYAVVGSKPEKRRPFLTFRWLKVESSSNLATAFPSLLIRNLVKFHLMALIRKPGWAVLR